MTVTSDIATTIHSVAGTGFQLSLILNGACCKIADAPAEVHSIAKNVTLYSLLIQHVGAVLTSSNSVHSDEALRTLEKIVEESNAVFSEINVMLDSIRPSGKDGAASPSIPQRIKWTFRRYSIEYLLARIDRLQMSLSLLLRIMELGSTMASTSVYDSPKRVATMMERVKRERVEAQNVVMLYYFEDQKVDKLYVTAREEQTIPQTPAQDLDSDREAVHAEMQLTAPEEGLPIWAQNIVKVQAPGMIFPDLGDSWKHIDRSLEDMLRSSEDIINKLLDRWTVWRTKRDQIRPGSSSSRRYNASVQDDPDDDRHSSYRDSDDSPNSKYLEGPTTDWRQPHSVEAKVHKARLKKAYAGYQPSVEGASDDERQLPSRSSSRKASRKHAINSDEETDDSDTERNVAEKPAQNGRARRRSSAVPVPNQQVRREDPEVSRSHGSAPRPNLLPGFTPSQRRPVTPTYPPPPQTRPYPTPDQHQHHAFTSPATGQNPMHFPYSPVTVQSPTANLPPAQAYPFPQQSSQQSRYAPRQVSQTSRLAQPAARPGSRDGSARPVSRDGRPARSPSRLTREYTVADYKEYEAERKQRKKEIKKGLSDSTAKGILGAGGLAVLLEALDVFS